MSSHIYLAHHGIKGMKWGVRRFQNEDGSLTSAGKKRYNVDINGAKIKRDEARKDFNKAYNEYMSESLISPNYKKLAERASAKEQLYKLAEENLSNERIKQKLNDETKQKSNHRLSLEQHYREKGMSEEEAAISAYRREKTERILIAVGATAVVAATAYVAYKHWDNSVDKILPEGLEMKRIASTAETHVLSGEYVAYKKNDTNTYLGLYGSQKILNGEEVYQKVMKTTGSIKIASRESGRKELSKLVNSDPEFRNELRGHLAATKFSLDIAGEDKRTPAQWATVSRAVKKLDKGVVDGDVYDAFNLTFTMHDSPLVQRFSNHMKKIGYGAIEDMNDKRLSGFGSKTPLILLSTSSVNVESVRKVGEAAVNRAYSEYASVELAKLAAGLGLTYGGAISIGTGAGLAIDRASSRASRDKIVADYRREHPNTTLSYNEIVENYYADVQKE